MAINHESFFEPIGIPYLSFTSLFKRSKKIKNYRQMDAITSQFVYYTPRTHFTHYALYL